MTTQIKISDKFMLMNIVCGDNNCKKSEIMKKHFLKKMRFGHVKNIYQKGLDNSQIYYMYHTFSAQWNDST